jgi:phosphonate transport system substrate-binding protein
MDTSNRTFLISCRVGLLALSVALVLLACTPAAAPTSAPIPTSYRPTRLTLAILPYRVALQIYDIWTPIADSLQAKTGLTVKVISADAFEDFVPRVLADRPEIVYFNSLQYLTVHRDAGYVAVVAPAPQSVGRIVVRTDSPIKTPEDLRGKTIALLPPTALPAHWQVRAFLLEHGLTADQDYKIMVVDNHTLAINAVIAGKVDAGAVPVPAFRTLPQETQAQLRMLADTPPQPPGPIAVRGDLDPGLRERITQAILALNDSKEGQAMIAKGGWDGMIPVTDETYDVTREFARKLGLGY